MTEERYIVMIDDNFHYMDEDHKYKHGEFSTYNEAVVACKKIVDEELADMLKQGTNPAKLSSTWSMFGDDSFILDDIGEIDSQLGITLLKKYNEY